MGCKVLQYPLDLNKIISFQILAVLVLWGGELLAHDPHDVIDVLEVPEPFAKSQMVFLVQAGYSVLRSTDGGASWKALVQGLDNRYRFTSLVSTPAFDLTQTLFLGSDGDGVYRSHDGGASWHKVNTGLSDLRIQHLAIAPAPTAQPLVLAAGTLGGLFRTTDGGSHWQQVLDTAVKVEALAFMPGGRRVLIGDSQGSVHQSTDAGATWRRIVALPEAGAITSIAASPSVDDDKLIFVGTARGGMFRSADAGQSFVAINKGLTDRSVTSIAVSPRFAQDATVMAASWREAVFKSINGGQTWRKVGQGLSTSSQADDPRFAAPQFRDLRIVPLTSGATALFLAGFDGLFTSNNEGATWKQHETEAGSYLLSLNLSLAHDNDFNVAITTNGGGACVTRNSDLKWRMLTQGLEGMRLSRIREVVFSPSFSTDHTLFSSQFEGDHLLKSTNSGQSWTSVSLQTSWYVDWKRRILQRLRSLGLPNALTTDLLTESERIRNANPKGLAISPNYAVDGFLFIATRSRGILSSTDWGQSLQPLKTDISEFWSLAISPDFKSDRTLLASGSGQRGQGIYKSTDAGVTWKPVNRGLVFLDKWKEIERAGTRKASGLGRSPFYAIELTISPAYNEDSTVFAQTRAGLYKSVDGGDSWQQLGATSLGAEALVSAIALSPDYRDDSTVMISVQGRGLFKSTDAGHTFMPFGEALIQGNHAIKQLAFSPSYRRDRTLWAVSNEAVFRSQDEGVSWQEVERPIRYEDDRGIVARNRDLILYQGEWERLTNKAFSASSASYGRTVNGRVVFRFVGTGVRWIGARAPGLGMGEVFIDGQSMGYSDQFSPTEQRSVVTYSVENLDYGLHSLEIVVADRAHPQATGRGIVIDAFDVLGRQYSSQKEIIFPRLTMN